MSGPMNGPMIDAPAPWPFLVLSLAAAVTYAWRALGVALASRIDPGGPLSEWIGCVCYAMLAGLIARMIVLPVGPLEQTALAARVAAAVIALAIFFLARRNLGLGVLAGAGALVLMTWAGSSG